MQKGELGLELKLTQVARASLEKLRLDYENFLRHRHLPLWDREDYRWKTLVIRLFCTADEVAERIRRGVWTGGTAGSSGT